MSETRFKDRNPLRRRLFLVGLATLTGVCGTAVGFSTDAPSMDVKTVVARMEERNREREAMLHNYAVEREYKVENPRFHKQGTVHATMIYVAPHQKVFDIHSSSGTGFICKGVINRIMKAEIDNAKPELKPRSAITTENYEFEWLGEEVVNGRPQYVLRAKPKRKDIYLFDGKLWVEAEDFAVTRIEGHTAKNPSFWIRRVDFTHEYEKVGAFWLPARDHSVAQVFLFGPTTTDLRYTGYRVNEPDLDARAAEIQKRGDKLEIQIDSKDKK